MYTLDKRNNIMPKTGNENRRLRRKRMIMHNLPEFIMYVLGAIIMSYLGLKVLIIFVVYTVFSTLWFMRFICTYCPHYDKLKCPSGYAMVAAKLFKKRNMSKFHTMFKRHIVVVFPTWFVPVIAGIYLLIIELTIEVIVLLIIFILDAFIILPWASRTYGCNHCELKDKCPWMGGFGN